MNIIQTKNLKRSFQNGTNITEVLKGIDFCVQRGEFIAIMGRSGAGKSTLIKGLIGELKPLTGVIERFSGTKIGYFAQHQVDHLPLNYSPLELLREQEPGIGEKELTAYLGSFGFDRDK